jgi:hypothetical protein
MTTRASDRYELPTARHQRAWHVPTTAGIEIVPCDVMGSNTRETDIGGYIEGERQGPSEVREGWYARYLSPSTAWVGPYEDETQARQALALRYAEERVPDRLVDTEAFEAYRAMPDRDLD